MHLKALVCLGQKTKAHVFKRNEPQIHVFVCLLATVLQMSMCVHVCSTNCTTVMGVFAD